MSSSVQLHRRQPTRLPRPWDSPGKNTGVGCHFLLQCMKVKVKSLSLSTLRNPIDCSLPGSSVHGIFQETVLEWVAIQFSPVEFSRSVLPDSLRLHESQHARQASLSITNSQSLLKLMSFELVMPSSHLILCHPFLLLPTMPPISGSFPMSQLFA